MNVRRATTSASAVLAAGIATVGIAVTLGTAPHAASTVTIFLLATALGGLTLSLEVLVTFRRPDNIVGTLLAALGLCLVAMGAAQVVLEAGSKAQELPPVAQWAVALTRESAVWAAVFFGLLMLHFPDGRVPGPRWRWVPPVLIAAAFSF